MSCNGELEFMSQINQMDIKGVGGTITGYEEHKPQVNHMYLCYGHVVLDTCLSALSTKKERNNYELR